MSRHLLRSSPSSDKASVSCWSRGTTRILEKPVPFSLATVSILRTWISCEFSRTSPATNPPLSHATWWAMLLTWFHFPCDTHALSTSTTVQSSTYSSRICDRLAVEGLHTPSSSGQRRELKKHCQHYSTNSYVLSACIYYRPEKFVYFCTVAGTQVLSGSKEASLLILSTLIDCHLE